MRGMDAELRLHGSIYAVLWNKYSVIDRFIKLENIVQTKFLYALTINKELHYECRCILLV